MFPIPPCTSLDDREDIRAVAEEAYVWGWTLVNVANRANQMSKFANGKPLLVNGWPIGYNSFTLQTQPTKPKQRLMCCPNTSLRYGGGAFVLGKKGVVAQVPQELCDSEAFWLYSLYDARSRQFGAIGKQHPPHSESGLYLIVGPKWDGTKPAEVPDTHIIKDPDTTNLVFLTARIFLDPGDNPTWLHAVNFYPAKNYVPGEWKKVNWEEDVDDITCPGPIRKKERRYVHPLTFFDQLPAIMDSVDPLGGEKDLYKCFRELLKKAADDPSVMRLCRSVAFETERTIIESYMLWSNNGVDAGNGWYTSVNSGQWLPTEYHYRTATAKSNLFQNRPDDTRYFCTDHATDGAWLNGGNTYKIIFEDGLPPATGPWSVTVYNQYHFLYAEPYSFSQSDLDPADPDDPKVVYAGPVKPAGVRYYIKTPPNKRFCLYLRAYGLDESGLPGPWQPPKVEKQ
jgi:hypothetical protein